jgi:hypothetical protein
MAGSTGATHFAGMLNINIMIQQDATNTLTRDGIMNDRTRRAQSFVRQYSNFSHDTLV